MSTMLCEIVSAEKALFSGIVKQLTARGSLGDLGVTPGHAPLLTGIQPGVITLHMDDDSEEVFYASGGYIEVQPGMVTVLADSAARAEDLDEAQAQQARDAAAAAMRDQTAEFDYSVLATQLAEAVAQQRTLQELRRRKS